MKRMLVDENQKGITRLKSAFARGIDCLTEKIREKRNRAVYTCARRLRTELNGKDPTKLLKVLRDIEKLAKQGKDVSCTMPGLLRALQYFTTSGPLHSHGIWALLGLAMPPKSISRVELDSIHDAALDAMQTAFENKRSCIRTLAVIMHTMESIGSGLNSNLKIEKAVFKAAAKNDVVIECLLNSLIRASITTHNGRPVYASQMASLARCLETIAMIGPEKREMITKKIHGILNSPEYMQEVNGNSQLFERTIGMFARVMDTVKKADGQSTHAIANK